jgi:phosphate-selective porin OprO and OprP
MKYIPTNLLKYSLTAMLSVFFSITIVSAQNIKSDTPGKPAAEKSILEHIWEVPQLYEDDKNKVIQEFSIIGRYHGQYWSARDDKDKEEGWENRRIYVGAEARLFHNLTLHGQIKISDDFNPVYNGLYQAFVRWSPSKKFTMSAGRLDFLFVGLERSISSTRIVTFERSLLTNQLLPHEVVGAVAQGKSGNLTWRTGVFSGNIEQEFTNFSGGFGAVADVGYELPLFYSEGSLHLEYLYNNGNPSDNALEPYNHVLSLWHQGRSGPLSLGTEIIAAHGLEGHRSVIGITVLPTLVLWKNVVFKGDALEAILRYHYAVSNGENGLYLQQRYEQKIVPGGAGDHYNALYGGINWLIYESRLKLMTGVEYSAMKDTAEDGGTYKGWTYLAGGRIYF